MLLAVLVGCSSSTENIDSNTSDQKVVCPDSCASGDLAGDLFLTPVNRRRGLRSDWAPSTELLPPAYVFGGDQRLRVEARDAFVRMANSARETARIELSCSSGYRSFARQCTVFNNYAAQSTCEQANTFSAMAGHSEHQLGTVCDIALGRDNGPFIAVGDAGDLWLTAHAYEFGLANSYPHDDKTLNDGYIREPWHYRFVGVAAARAIRDRGRISIPVFIASLSAEEAAALEAGAIPSGSIPTP